MREGLIKFGAGVVVSCVIIFMFLCMGTFPVHAKEGTGKSAIDEQRVIRIGYPIVENFSEIDENGPAAEWWLTI